MSNGTIAWGFQNLLNGRDPQQVARSVIEKFDAKGLDVLGLTEFRDYLHAIRAAAMEAGYVVVTGTVENQRGSGQNALLVRDRRALGHHWGFVSGTPYYAKGGAERAAAVSLAAEAYGVLWIVGHAPVSAWKPIRGGRGFVGAVRRRLAYRKHVRRTAAVFRRHKRVTVVCMEDWNATPPPNTTGRWSPEWLRRKVGAEYLRPHRSTGHGEIDFAMVRGPVARRRVRGVFRRVFRRVQASRVHLMPKDGSDHHGIAGTIEA